MMTTSRTAVAAGAAAILGIALAAGCEKKAETPPVPPAPTDTATPPPAPSPSGMTAPSDGLAGVTGRASELIADGKQKAVELANQGLTTVETKFAQLRERAEAVAAENKPAFDKAVADAQTQLTSLREQIESLGDAGSDAWQKLSADVQTELAELTGQLDEALKQFQG